MKIYFASDHAGFQLKENLIAYVQSEFGNQYEVEDCGAYTHNPQDDYPEFIACAAKGVVSDTQNNKAIILGGSGQGEAIIANRHKGIRAIVFNGQYKPDDGRDVPDVIVLSREHNNSNVLSLGSRFLKEEEAQEAVRVWLTTEFSGDERHVRRNNAIDTI